MNAAARLVTRRSDCGAGVFAGLQSASGSGTLVHPVGRLPVRFVSRRAVDSAVSVVRIPRIGSLGRGSLAGAPGLLESVV